MATLSRPRPSIPSASSSSSSLAPKTSSTSLSTSTSPASTSIPTRKFQGHRAKVRSLAWNVDGRRLASGSTDGSLRLWQPERDSKTNIEMKGHTNEVSKIIWNPTHPEHLASCSAARATPNMPVDKTVFFWDLRVSGPTRKVETQGGNLTMTWSLDGKTLLVGNRDDVVTWIDTDTGKVIKEVRHGGETNEANFSHTGKLLMTTVNGNVVIKTFPEEVSLHTVNIAMGATSTTTLDLDPRGKYMAAGSNDTLVTLWETSEWTCLESVGYHDTQVRMVRFSHDGLNLATFSDRSEIIILEVPTLKKVTTIPATPCNSIAWHPSKPWLAYATDEMEQGRVTGAFRIWGL